MGFAIFTGIHGTCNAGKIRDGLSYLSSLFVKGLFGDPSRSLELLLHPLVVELQGIGRAGPGKTQQTIVGDKPSLDSIICDTSYLSAKLGQEKRSINHTMCLRLLDNLCLLKDTFPILFWN